MRAATLQCIARAGAAAVLAAAAGCGRFGPDAEKREEAGPSAPAPFDQVWTPERIAREPMRYFPAADQEIARHVAERQARIAALEASEITVSQRAEKLRQGIRDAGNIRKRLQAAFARAEEDGAWPLAFAGRKLERAQAQAIMDAAARYVESRTALAADYDSALAKVRTAARALRSDIAELERMREKLALDLERVKLNQGIAEVAELRRSADALSGFATSLADTTENPLEDLAEKARPLAAETELNTLLGEPK